MKTLKGYDRPANGKAKSLELVAADNQIDTVVIDDLGNGFRDEEGSWRRIFNKNQINLIFYKMNWPLCEGNLWKFINKGYLDKLFVIVKADDLRLGGAQISRGLSWEKIALDFINQVYSSPKLKDLSKSRGLIVRFGVEGVILVENSEGILNYKLFYDPNISEGTVKEFYPGKMNSLGRAFAASLMHHMTQSGSLGLKEGIREGLIASRKLWLYGYGNDQYSIDYPYEDIFLSRFKSDPEIVMVSLPNPKVSKSFDENNWSVLVDLAYRGFENIAYDFVKVPIVKFTKLAVFPLQRLSSGRRMQKNRCISLARHEEVVKGSDWHD